MTEPPEPIVPVPLSVGAPVRLWMASLTMQRNAVIPGDDNVERQALLWRAEAQMSEQDFRGVIAQIIAEEFADFEVKALLIQAIDLMPYAGAVSLSLTMGGSHVTIL